jgi:hypothetical protein
VTTSGVLVTLLLGFAALITSKSNYALPSVAMPWLYASVGSFVLAALGGLLTNRPVPYEGVTADALLKLAQDKWSDSTPVAERRVFVTRIKFIRRYKATNTTKARLLTAAIGFEVLAILSLAVSVGLIVNHG